MAVPGRVRETLAEREQKPMKKTRMLVAGVALGMVALGLTGCQNSEKDKAAPATVEKKAEEAKPTAAPAAQKPKDHPAH